MSKFKKYIISVIMCMTIGGIFDFNYVKADYCIVMSESQCYEYMDRIDANRDGGVKALTLLAFRPQLSAIVGIASLGNHPDNMYDNCKLATRNHCSLGVCIGDPQYYSGPPYNMAYIPMEFTLI